MSVPISPYVWYCLSVTVTTILPILEDNHHPRNNPDQLFYHPFMQAEIQVVGEMLCLFVFLALRCAEGKNEVRDGSGVNLEQKVSKPAAPLMVCVVPTVLNLLASCLEYMALNYISGSTFSISSSVSIVSTCICSKFILGTLFQRHHLISCLLAVSGVVILGLGQSLGDDGNYGQEHLILGLSLNIAAYIIVGIQIVIKQRIFLKYEITPNQLGGYCGTIGTIIFTCLLVILSFVGCPLDSSQCVMDNGGIIHLQSFSAFFDDLSGDWYLMAMVVINVLMIARFYYDQNTLVFMGSAVFSQVVNIFSNGVIWIVGVLVTVIGEGSKEFNIQSLQVEVIFVKLLGFTITIFSLLLYNGTIRPCWTSKKEEELLTQTQESFI